jgi:hypothetical protein
MMPFIEEFVFHHVSLFDPDLPLETVSPRWRRDMNALPPFVFPQEEIGNKNFSL